MVKSAETSLLLRLYLSVAYPWRWAFNRFTRISRLPSNSRFASPSASRREITSNPPSGSSFEHGIKKLTNSLSRLLDSSILGQASECFTVLASVANNFIAASFNSAHECESTRINNAAAFSGARNLPIRTEGTFLWTWYVVSPTEKATSEVAEDVSR